MICYAIGRGIPTSKLKFFSTEKDMRELYEKENKFILFESEAEAEFIVAGKMDMPEYEDLRSTTTPCPTINSIPIFCVEVDDSIMKNKMQVGDEDLESARLGPPILGKPCGKEDIKTLYSVKLVNTNKKISDKIAITGENAQLSRHSP